MGFDVLGKLRIALDQMGQRRAAAEGFDADDAGPGKNINKLPTGNRVAEDAEIGFGTICGVGRRFSVTTQLTLRPRNVPATTRIKVRMDVP